MTRQKPTKADKSDAERGSPPARLDTLTPAQAKAVDLVALGKLDEEVGQAVGVTRQTVNVWRNHHPAFAVAVEARRREAWSAATDGLRAILPKAVKVLDGALDGPDGWRVALSLVKVGGIVHGSGGLTPHGPDDEDEWVERQARDRRTRSLFGESDAFVSAAWTWAECNLADELDAVGESGEG